MSADRPIIIKKVKKVVGGGHHGGAWKVAYADFVTAMMAFFLLMWLINVTSPEQKRGIADYFAPASVSETTSGAGGILGGTALGQDGAQQDGSRSVVENIAPDAQKEASAEAAKNVQDEKENADFQSAAMSLRQAMQSMPELAELSKQIMIDKTPEGLRIQLVDQEGRSMFDEGSAKPNPRAQLLLRAVSKIINQLPNRVNVYGHTSLSGSGRAAPTDRTLSANRANAAADVIRASGVDGDRVYLTGGKAAADPLFPDDPTLPGNRRIEIILLHESSVLPPEHTE